MKKIGILIPTTNLTVEYEIQKLLRNNLIGDTIFYVNRIPYNTSYKKNKDQFLKEIAENGKTKLNELKYLQLDYHAFFCTSLAIVNKEKMGIHNPSEALIEAAKNLGIAKCMLITPYDNKIGDNVKKHLENNDIVILKCIHLNLLDTKEYFKYGIENLEQLIVAEYKNEYENIVISCTNLPTLHLMHLEDKLEANIISSNLSMFWKICHDNRIKTGKISNLFKKGV